jgi:hypothetical protein
MVKKAHIIINLLSEASDVLIIQIEEKIRNEAKIPLCKEIEKVAIEDIESSYINLKKHGFSNIVAKTLWTCTLNKICKIYSVTMIALFLWQK